MAAGFSIQEGKLSCSICMDLFKDPVTIPCGHNYCMSCIEAYWDRGNGCETHRCPLCRQICAPRPLLKKNTTMAELVEDLKKEGHQAAGPGDVVCDFCTGKKLKAIKSCLTCMASYCEQHLQPHYHVAPLQKHKLVKVTSELQENICPLHNEVMKIFCLNDHRCICYLCSMDDHKGHETVSAVSERAKRQVEVDGTRQTIQQKIQDRGKDVAVLLQRLAGFNLSADEAVRDSKKVFAELIRHVEKRSAEVEQQIRSQQESEVSRAEELEEKLREEITELQRRDAELGKLSLTEDHLHFLNNYRALSHLKDSIDSSSTDICPPGSFNNVAAGVSEVRDQLQTVLSEGWAKISQAETEAVVKPSPQSLPWLPYDEDDDDYALLQLAFRTPPLPPLPLLPIPKISLSPLLNDFDFHKEEEEEEEDYLLTVQ